MSKEKALGSIPTFESVERATTDLDLFKEEPKKEESTKEKLKKDILSNILKDKEEFKKNRQEATLEETKEFLEDHNERIKEIQEREIEKETRRSSNEKPSTQRAVRKGYIRQTFVISKENLEIIRALTSFLNTTQVDLLEALINKGLEVFSDEDKEQALKLFRSSNKEEKESTLNKYFN